MTSVTCPSCKMLIGSASPVATALKELSQIPDDGHGTLVLACFDDLGDLLTIQHDGIYIAIDRDPLKEGLTVEQDDDHLSVPGDSRVLHILKGLLK